MEHITLEAPPTDQALKLEDQEWPILPLIKSRAVKADTLHTAARESLFELQTSDETTVKDWEAVAKKFALVIDTFVQIKTGQPKPSKILTDGYIADNPLYTLSNLTSLVEKMIEVAARPTVTS